MASTGTSAVVVAVRADDGHRGGQRRGDRLVEHPLGLGGVDARPARPPPAARSASPGPAGGQGGGDRVGGALAVQLPAVGGLHDARRRALDRDGGVDRRAVDLLGEGLELRPPARCSSALTTGSTSRSEKSVVSRVQGFSGWSSAASTVRLDVQA